VVALCYPFIVAASEFSWYVTEPRYLLLLLPIIALFEAYALAQMGTRFMAMAVVVVLALCVMALPTMREDLGAAIDSSSAVQTLEAHQVDRAFAEYDIAYPITFVADEEVIATSSGHVRYEPHDAAVRSHPNPAWVFGTGSWKDSAFAQALDGLGVSYERVEFEDFVVYFPVSAVHPEAVPAVR
jgi:hypothetical protein